eukprot:UN26025
MDETAERLKKLEKDITALKRHREFESANYILLDDLTFSILSMRSPNCQFYFG